MWEEELSILFSFVSEKKCRKGKRFSVLQFRFINSVYLLNVAVPPLPVRAHVSGAARPLWQESQSELREDCRRSSPTSPATAGTMQWDLRGQEKTTYSNKVWQVFLTFFCPYSLVAHPQPSQSAAILACSCQGVLLPKPSLLQDLGWWIWWEFSTQQDLWKQTALAFCYREQDLLGWVLSAVGSAHRFCTLHQTKGPCFGPLFLGCVVSGEPVG